MPTNPISVKKTLFSPWMVFWLALLAGVGAWRAMAPPGEGNSKEPDAISPNKLKEVNGREYLWAAGRRDDPNSQWFDITGSPLKKERFQFGIGKDRIRTIDDPLFVKPTDARLWAVLGRNAENIDSMSVIGYADGNDARAYPVELLDHHEVVNDTIAGKPVAVGW